MMGCSSLFQQQHYYPPNTLIFGSIGYKDLAAASLALTSIDHILLLGQNDLNDVAMRAGMGGMGKEHERQTMEMVCIYLALRYLPEPDLSSSISSP
jgi:hypothetical protein